MFADWPQQLRSIVLNQWVICVNLIRDVNPRLLFGSAAPFSGFLANLAALLARFEVDGLSHGVHCVSSSASVSTTRLGLFAISRLQCLLIFKVTAGKIITYQIWLGFLTVELFSILIVTTASLYAFSEGAVAPLGQKGRPVEILCVLGQHLEVNEVGELVADHGTVHENVVLLLHQRAERVYV